MNPFRQPSALDHHSTPSPWVLRWVLGVLGLMVGASLVTWGLRWSQPPASLSAPIQLPVKAPPPEWVVKALAPAPVQDNGQGTAVLAGDSTPPASWRVGQTLPDGLVVLRVHPKGVDLGDASGGVVRERLILPDAPSVSITTR